MRVERDQELVRDLLRGWRHRDESICLVPTMGYFHDGHIALMKKAHEVADKAVVSLFVNPTQFSAGEDLDSYPQNFEGDCRQAKDAGIDLLFCPSSEDMYSPDHQTTVAVAKLSSGLCGTDRPGHFAGVTTVVAKLFNIIGPDSAIFGEKDYQQLTVIRQMVADLNFPVKIIGHPIIRETDGLAMSSRNSYLNSEERKSAVLLSKALKAIGREVRAKGVSLATAPLLDMARQIIESDPQCSVDYLTIIDNHTLQECAEVSLDCRAIGAIKINHRIRLIDNLSLVS